MSAKISSIHYCPVKSISYQTFNSCVVKKNIGIERDRVFAFTSGLSLEDTKMLEQNHEYRKGKWNKILTLKNCPVLNKYNFLYNEEKLSLIFQNRTIISINSDDFNERKRLTEKIIELENSIKKPIALIKNKELPFFDTTISTKVDFVNSVSLLNIKSIKDFSNKINKDIEIQRFRGNILIDGVKAWEERNWIGKIIQIGDVKFKVLKNIPRCIAINLKPNTDDKNLNLLKSLKKNYKHFDMGIYLIPLSNGKIELDDNLSFF